MQNYHPKLGNLCSVHTPSKPHLLLAWLMLLSMPILGAGVLCTFLILDSLTGFFTGNKEGTADDVSNYFICMGVLGLILVALGSLSVSEYRAWSATRTVKLIIYEEGFTYESQGRIEGCRWDEIEKIKYKSLQVVSKAFRRRVKVIRAIVKKDGAMIKLADTLDLQQITKIITEANKGAI